MSNKKKLKSRDGATRITPDKYTGDFCGRFKLQVYDKASDQWGDIEGCALLTWTEATTARKNFVALRQACKVANSSTMNINIPSDEVNGN
jgi:hypothetical protein